MKPLFVSLLILAMLTGCQSQPSFTDNGNSGQIKAVVFYDDNHNQVMDSGEAGAPIEVGISQDISCPAASMDQVTVQQPDASGIAMFMELKPGKYCVATIGNYSMTTKLTQEVYVSSEAVTVVVFGIARE